MRVRAAVWSKSDCRRKCVDNRLGTRQSRPRIWRAMPWDDLSEAWLLDWKDISQDEFYDVSKIAAVPVEFCYPGTRESGDLSPLSEYAQLWHDNW